MESPLTPMTKEFEFTREDFDYGRLNQSATINVCEAEDGQPILPGHAYLAPGGRHLRIKRSAKGFRCLIDDGPQVNRHKPSVDVLFKSVAETAGANAVGVLLTGMGDDGSESLGLMQAAGAFTIAQDEASSVVWGMPGEAVKKAMSARWFRCGKSPIKFCIRFRITAKKH